MALGAGQSVDLEHCRQPADDLDAARIRVPPLVAGGLGPAIQQPVEGAGPDGAVRHQQVRGGEGRSRILTGGADEAHGNAGDGLDASRQHCIVIGAGQRQGHRVFGEQALGQRAPGFFNWHQPHPGPVHPAHRHVAGLGRCARARRSGIPGHRPRLLARIFNCAQAATGQSEQGRERQRRRPHDPQASPRAHYSLSGEQGDSSVSGSGGGLPGSGREEPSMDLIHESTFARA